MQEKERYLTVSALTKYLHRKFSADPYLGRVYLTGEISNFRLRPRHQYFCLKDDSCKIDAVMYEGSFKKLKFQPEEGMKILAIGRIDLYEPSGVYQIIIEKLQPDGVGALYQAYEQLKKKLAAEGLFSAPKKSLVRYPKRIAVITSPSGAVIRDIITTLKRRYPIAQIVLFPAVVQGEQAVDSLVARLKEVNMRGDFDTLIIGRGGGSIEDLWAFNEEKVAKAIYASEIPVISSVGHETDTTIADFVADVRAATPTAAAELAAPVLSDELLKIGRLRQSLLIALKNRLDLQKKHLAQATASYVFRQPNRLYEGYLQKLDRLNMRQNQVIMQYLNRATQECSQLKNRLELQNPQELLERKLLMTTSLSQRLKQAMEIIIKQDEQFLINMIQSLDALSPLKVMGRGFSYVTSEKEVITSVKQLKKEQLLTLHLLDGVVQTKVKEIKEDND